MNIKPTELHTLLNERHSGREYDTAKDLSELQVQELVDAAHLAPSCYNEQPWHFIIAHRERNRETYESIYHSLVEFNQGWAKDVPLLIVSLTSTLFRQNGKPNRWGSYDTGAATFSMMLMAHAQGLMAHQMGGFDENKLIKAFNLSKEYTPMAVMAVGYEKTSAAPSPKERRDSSSHFHYGSFP
ncbi:nitroreductase family protein [Chlamydiales bacterium]|nr:nitroreductase family protein [Chlamydiales bacterium]